MSYPKPGIPFRIMNRVHALLPVKSKMKFQGLLLGKTLDAPAKPEAMEGVTFSVANHDDIVAMKEHPEALAKSLYDRRIENGDICLCLKKDGELVSYNWIRFTSCCARCGKRVSFSFIPLEKNQAFTYDFYTYKKFRGSGLGGYLKKCLLHELYTRGITEVLSIVKPSNDISLRIHVRLDYDLVTVVFGYCIYSWTKTFLGSKKDILRMRQWVAGLSEASN